MSVLNSPKLTIDPNGVIKLAEKVATPNLALVTSSKMVFRSDKIIVSPRYGGRMETDYSSAQGSEAVYDITGTHDKHTAYARFAEWIFGNVPLDEGGWPVESLTVEGNEDGTKQWTGYAKYSNKMIKRDLDIPIQSFSTKGGTAKKTQSYATIQSVGRPGMVIPNYYGGIGVKDNTLEGCDVIVSNYTTTFERKGLPYQYVNANYRQLLRMMTGSINTAPFDGMAPGECLFTGCDGNMNIGEENGKVVATWDLKFEFRAAPNVGGLVIGDLPPIDKRAWDYLWVLRQEEDDEESGKTIPRPVAAYVEQVYLYSNFQALGIFA